MKKGMPPIVVEQLIKQPVSRVWQAITVLDEMKQWYFENIPAFETKVGFTTRFDVQSEGRNFCHIWTITEVIPINKLSYSWQYTEYSGKSTLSFDLFERQDNTLVRVTTEVLESFPQNIPEFTRDSCTAGWEYFIQGRLKEYLEK